MLGDIEGLTLGETEGLIDVLGDIEGLILGDIESETEGLILGERLGEAEGLIDEDPGNIPSLPLISLVVIPSGYEAASGRLPTYKLVLSVELNCPDCRYNLSAA